MHVGDQLDLRKRLEALASALEIERASHEETWRQIYAQVAPRRKDIRARRKNDGRRRDHNILNNTGVMALRTFASGLFAGLTSPARPWFQLEPFDRELKKRRDVANWIDHAEKVLYRMMAGTNLYHAFPGIYREMGAIGTSCSLLLPDDETGLRVYQQPTGSYTLAVGPKLAPDTVFRQLKLTVRQVVETFGAHACSGAVREEYRRQHYQEPVEVMHAILPRPHGERGALAERKPIASLWWEKRPHDGQNPPFLKTSGFDRSPLVAPRWDVIPGETYGESPGRDALGDMRALQKIEERHARLLHLHVQPPLTAPSSLERSGGASLQPGSYNYVDPTVAALVQPSYQPRIAPNVLENDIRRTEERIKSAFFADLFLLVQQMDRRQVTAREIEELSQERFTALGPALESTYQELLVPVVDLFFDHALESGALGRPPDVLEGTALRVRIVSILAAAQLSQHAYTLQSWIANLLHKAEARPEVLDLVDWDAEVREDAELRNIPGAVLRDPEDVAAERKARAEQERAMQLADQAPNVAQAARNLSETRSAGGVSMLDRIVGGAA